MQVSAQKLTLEHRSLLDSRLKKTGSGFSDHSFANLYLFREAFNSELLVDRENVFVRGKTYDNFTFLMPTAAPKQQELGRLKELMRQADFLYPVPEAWLKCFPENEFQTAFNDGESDYIYELSRMSEYPGRKLHKKRNLLKQFLSGYDHRVYPLTADRIAAAEEILTSWQEESGQERARTDYYPCQEALQRNEELVLCGMVYYVENEPAGFLLGEELTSEIFDVKFAKAKKKFKGIYQYLFNDFAKLLPKKYAYFNLEEDLGQPGLRKAKDSYQPVKKLVKYRVSERPKF